MAKRKEKEIPREGWEDGTPPPHRDQAVKDTILLNFQRARRRFLLSHCSNQGRTKVEARKREGRDMTGVRNERGERDERDK